MSTTGPFVSTPRTPPPANSDASPVSTPTTQTPPAAVPSKSRLAALKEWATPISILVLALSIAFYAFYGRSTPEPAGVDGVALGRSYAPYCLKSYADAWDIAADQLASGKTVAESQKAMATAWKDARLKAFEKNVTPSLARVLPEGTEPRDDSHRREVAQLWHDFAKGLRKAR